MKYNQYVEAKQLFESDMAISNGYDINEWEKLSPEEKLEQLNEILGLSAATGLLGKLGIGAAAGILGLGVAFRKKLISAGLKSIYIKRLRKTADKFKVQSMAGLVKSIKPLIDAKNKIKADSNIQSWEELPTDKKQKLYNIEKRIERALQQYISKVRDVKDAEVDKKIEASKKLSDSAKSALKYAWITMATEVEISLLAELMKDKVIESPQIVKDLDDYVDKKEKNMKSKINNFKSQNNKEEKPKEEEKSKEEITITPGDKFILKSKQFSPDKNTPAEKEIIITEIKDGSTTFKWKNDKGEEMESVSKKDIKPFIVKKIENTESNTETKEGELKDKKL